MPCLTSLMLLLCDFNCQFFVPKVSENYKIHVMFFHDMYWFLALSHVFITRYFNIAVFVEPLAIKVFN